MATYPDEDEVKEGVVYGPNDNDYTGTYTGAGVVYVDRPRTKVKKVVEEVPIIIPPELLSDD